MKLIKEISYTDIMQRKLLYLDAFISSCILLTLYFDCAQLMYFIDIYGTALKSLFIFGSAGLFIGNIAGGILLRKLNSRLLFIISESAFIIITGAILTRDLLKFVFPDLIPSFIQTHSTLLPIIISIVPLILGVKAHYFLKIICGNFIDDKKGAIPFIMAIISGAVLGIGVFGLINIFRDYSYFSAILTLPLLPAMFLIRLSYSMLPQYAQETNESIDIKPDDHDYRDDVYFTFLNFSCILVYIFLGYKIIVKSYGNLFHIQILFFLVLIPAFLIGFALARWLKNAFWFIYSEMLFPVSFLFFTAAVYIIDIDIIIYEKILIFSVPSAIFGFSFYKTMNNIMMHYDHEKRFSIMNFSLFVLPIPLVIALSNIDFTSLWFYIFLYLIMIINAIFPGIHLIQSSIKSYKKIIYFIFTLVFIPTIIYFHGYLNIPLNNELFVNHVNGFQLLYNNKYNSLYINTNSNVLFHDNLIFTNNDAGIRNLNRILIPLYIFCGESKENDKILFIDGNQKFFRNSTIAYFKNYHVLDYVTERKVDYNTLPLAGNQRYIVEKSKIVDYINKKISEYDAIVDIPNILDQNYYEMRFSESYINIIQKALKENGVFAQVINVNQIKKKYFENSIEIISKRFKKTIGFQCSDQIIFLSSNDEKRLTIRANNYSLLQELFSKNSELIYLFYNENQLLSHCIFSDIKSFTIEKSEMRNSSLKDVLLGQSYRLNESMKKSYLSSGGEFMSLIPDDLENAAFKRSAQYEYMKNSELYLLLKTAELAGVERDFEKEAETLSIIDNKFKYREDLRKYIFQIFALKKELYFSTAIELEKEKKWEEAKQLYSALLKIDNNHFDANYRMGLLYITLQNMTDAFTYMKQAMNLKNDDPRVQYQMGVLLFSSGKAQEALKYLDRALELKQDSASLYLYIGFCYEEMGKYYEAKNYYQKAVLKDPNDSNSKLSIDRINVKIQDEVDKWKTKDPTNQNEAEQGENIPLPINKSAYDWRITDEEAKRMKGTQ